RIAVKKYMALEEDDVEKKRHVAVAFEASIAVVEKVQKVAVEVEEENFIIFQLHKKKQKS
ncbi:7475_t:CDS:2, partial [Funneliformis geosporum]